LKSLRKTLCALLAVLMVLPLSCFHIAAADDAIEITFCDAASAASIFDVTSATAAFKAEEGAVNIKATGTAPAVSFPVAGFDPSYDYAVITYRLNDTNSAGAFEGTLALTDGTATYSRSFSYIRGYKYYSTIIDIKDAESANTARLSVFSGSIAGDNIYLYGVSFCKTEAEAKSAANALALEANGPILSKYTESELKTDSYIWDDYMIPYWNTDLVINEGVYPLKEANGTIRDISLMYSPDRIISVRSSTLDVEYKEGVDYELVNGKLRILLTGSIPCVNYTDHYFTTQRGNSYRIRNTNPARYVRFEEGRAIPLAQLAVTYTHTDEWEGFIPENQGESLPLTLSKLENGESLNFIYFGDSITNGGNSSGPTLNMAPYADAWTTMFEKKIRSLYPNANITFSNTSVSGGCWDNSDPTYAGYAHVYDSIVNNNPDIVMLALGTNDYQFASVGDPNQYMYSPASTYEKVSYVIGTIKQNLPNCEIILVAPMFSNPECFDPDILDAYIEGYRDIASQYSGIVIADVNSVQKYMFQEKGRYTDMSANNLCHANDYFARVYAQVLLKTVTPEYLSENSKVLAKNRLNYITNINNYFTDQQNEIRNIIAAASAQIDAAATYEEMLDISRDAKLAILAVPDKKAVIIDSVDYKNIIFDNAQKAELFSSSTYVTVSYNSNETAIQLKATATNRDPHTTIVYPQAKALNASSHQYVVLTYKTPASNSASATTTQVYFSTGSVTAPSESQVINFTVERDGDYHSKVIDLSSCSWWSGKINQIRIDPFKTCSINDIMYISSLCLCSTAEEAEAVAENREARANGTYAGSSSVISFDTEEALSHITAPYVSILAGDANQDGKINAKDTLAIKKFISGITTSAVNDAYYDLNGDGKVNARDITMLKFIIAGISDYFYSTAKGSECDKVFNDTDNSAALSAGQGQYATFSADLNFESPACAVLIYKATGSPNTTVYFGDHVETDASTTVTLDVASEYNSLIIDLPASYDSSSITIDVSNVNIEVDSFGFFEITSTATNYANGRLWERQSPVVYNENIEIKFDDDMMDNISYSNSAIYSNNSRGELTLTVSNAKTDPYVYLDLTSLGISANDYKYIVYTYKIPTSNSENKGRNAQIFFCSSNAADPAEASSLKFDLSKDGAYHNQTVDLSTASYWGGNVLGLRIDFFCDADPGDTSYIRSITFCKSEHDLQAALENN